MSDLVTRLRKQIALEIERHGGFESAETNLLKEAADRIEYLESVAGVVSQGEYVEAYKELLDKARSKGSVSDG